MFGKLLRAVSADVTSTKYSQTHLRCLKGAMQMPDWLISAGHIFNVLLYVILNIMFVMAAPILFVIYILVMMSR